MRVNIVEISSNRKQMDVTIPWGEVSADFEKFGKKFAKTLQIPGFRKGHIPKSILDRQFGPRMEYEFVTENFNKFYFEGLKQTELTPVSEPDLKDMNFKKDEEISLSFEIDVIPVWEMPDFKNDLKIDKPQFDLTEADIEDALLRLRQDRASVIPVTDGAEAGHHLTADFIEAGDDDQPLADAKPMNQIPFKLGDEQYDGDFMAALLGVKSGEIRIAPLAIKDGEIKRFSVKVTAVEQHELPELNDEFAQTVSEEFETVAVLKERLKDDMEKHWQNEANKVEDENIIRYFVDALKDLEMPHTLVEGYIAELIKDHKEKYSYDKANDETLEKYYTQSAVNGLKWQFVKEKLEETEDSVKVTNEEVDAEIEKLLMAANEELRDVYRQYYRSKESRSRLRYQLQDTKILDYLKSAGKVKVKKIKREDRLKGDY